MERQRGIAQLYFLLIILSGIAIAVVLVQYTQVFKPKAFSEEELATYCEENQLDAGNDASVNIDADSSGATGFFVDRDGNIFRSDSGSTGFYITRDGSIRRTLEEPGSTPEPNISIDLEPTPEPQVKTDFDLTPEPISPE